MIHLPEPDILHCKVKWALGSITTNKASGGDGIPIELFQILKVDVVKVLYSICQQTWKLSSGHRTGKVSFHSNSKERQCQRMLKLSHNCSHLTHYQSNAQNSPSQASTVCELWPSRHSSWGHWTRGQIANICWIIEKAREFQKNIYFCSIDYAKAFDCVEHNKLENSSRDGNTRPPDLLPEKSVCRSRSNS